jgi:hypothetical protein
MMKLQAQPPMQVSLAWSDERISFAQALAAVAALVDRLGTV